MRLPEFYVEDIIKRALAEDINYIDVTTDYLLSDEDVSDCYFLAKDEGVVCGLEMAVKVFMMVEPRIQAEMLVTEGSEVKKGDVLLKLKGPAKGLLKGERTALNLVQHLSGIATATNRCVKAVAGTKAAVTDTRKTLPGLRALQKYAVVTGGGRNHRFNLSDGAMLKDNHVDAYGSLTNAVNTLRERVGHMVKIEVEVRTLEELREALAVRADVIMLDNMSTETMAEAVKIADGRALLEASGNVSLENIAEIAKTGVDIISLGALTHSVQCFDISMKYGII